MKRIFAWLLWAMALALPYGVAAQSDIWIKRFEPNPSSLIAQAKAVKDLNGRKCAVLRCIVRGTGFTFRPNLGCLRKEVTDGEVFLWVPVGTKKLTIKHKGLKPLIEYEIPVAIEAGVDYIVDIEAALHAEVGATKDNSVYIGAGYQVMAVSGPALTIGANMNHHVVELGAVYGLNKTDDLYFFDAAGNMKCGGSFNAVSMKLKYGYEIPIGGFLAIVPQVGIAYNAYLAADASKGETGTRLANTHSLSALGAVSLMAAVSDNFRFFVTPEYDAALQKGKTCELVSTVDDKMKGWHTGLTLNVGLMICF